MIVHYYCGLHGANSPNKNNKTSTEWIRNFKTLRESREGIPFLQVLQFRQSFAWQSGQIAFGDRLANRDFALFFKVDENENHFHQELSPELRRFQNKSSNEISIPPI
jgi:hypothetical protein